MANIQTKERIVVSFFRTYAKVNEKLILAKERMGIVMEVCISKVAKNIY